MKTYLSIALWTMLAYPKIGVAQQTKIDWDTWGVPHITAGTEKDLFFAQGWAEMQMHANLVLQIYGTSRGKAAAYWGAQFETSDKFIHDLDFQHAVLDYRKTQAPKLKQIIRYYTDGMNAYAKAHPEKINPDKRAVLPVMPDDVNLQYLYFFVVGRTLNKASGWQEVGSNAMAIAAKRSASGHAMLVQNPHLPWNTWYTFFENELTLKGNPMYGIKILGLPGFAMGFNRYLGWAHTDNNLANNDSFELTLKDGGYLLDGKKLDFKTRNDTIWVKQTDGTLLAKPIKCYASVHGTVVRMGGNKALAIRATGTDGKNGLLEMWKMANSIKFEQFEGVLKMMQIPNYNVIYADSQGSIFYLDNGLMPKRQYGVYEDWNQVIDGSMSKNIPKGYLTYNQLPRLKNPVSGWLQNANDPPWNVTLPREIDKNNYPAYVSSDEMRLRPQQAANMLIADPKITFDHLVDV